MARRRGRGSGGQLILEKMSDGKTYQIPEEVLAAHLQDEAVLLHVGTKRYFRLNATGAWIWKGIERGLSRGQIVDDLCETFEIERDAADQALGEHISRLREHDLVLED